MEKMESKTYEEDFKMIRSAIDGAKNPMNQLGGVFLKAMQLLI